MKADQRIARIREIITLSESAERTEGTEERIALKITGAEWHEIRQLVNVGKPKKPKKNDEV